MEPITHGRAQKITDAPFRGFWGPVVEYEELLFVTFLLQGPTDIIKTSVHNVKLKTLVNGNWELLEAIHQGGSLAADQFAGHGSWVRHPEQSLEFLFEVSTPSERD